jgi:hypothetical protein
MIVEIVLSLLWKKKISCITIHHILFIITAVRQRYEHDTCRIQGKNRRWQRTEKIQEHHGFEKTCECFSQTLNPVLLSNTEFPYGERAQNTLFNL